MSRLPGGWVLARIGDVGEIRLGKMLDKAKNQGEPVKYLHNINVRWFDFDLSDLQTMRATPQEREQLSIRDGDLLVCEGGEPGRCAVWRDGKNDLVYQKALHRIRTSLAVIPEVIMYRLRHDAENRRLDEAFTGTTIKHLTRESLFRYEIPLPPLSEQKRIADKLDAVLARVDACRERLDRVPLILRRFRQAVLAAAISGKLTESWREDCNLSYEDWQKLSLGEIVREVKNGLSPKPNEKLPGTPILRISSVRPFSVSFTDIRYLPPGIPVESYLLQPDDLLFTRYNGTREFVGVCGRVKSLPSYPVVYPDKLIRVRSNKEQALAGFIEIATSAPSSREVIEELAKTSAGQTGISGKDLKGLRVTLPSLLEQHEIVRRVESLFAYADRLEARYNTARAQVERLTPALLAKAFRGELVPQDPNDEPASVLLERIRNGKGVGRNKRSISGDRDRRERHAAFSQLTRSE